MSFAMPDSIYPANLPDGYPAYLGYVDGNWPTAHQLITMFPAARILALTVTGQTYAADGIDCEPGNPDAAGAAYWASRRMAPQFRPVIYASTIGTPGYGMVDVLPHLAALGITRQQVRLHTAHYSTQHLCGPNSCGLLSTDADATQWTDTHPGNHGSLIDMSICRDDFFGPPPPPADTTWTEQIMNNLPTLAKGDTGTHVRTVQFQLGEKGVMGVVIDGVYGAQTDAGVRQVQADRHLSVDGVVGPQTWPVLLGVA